MDDLEFAQRCIKGDKTSWNEFVGKYSRLIYNYILGVLRVRSVSYSQNDINDIFQEIFYYLIKDNFKKLSTFKAKNGCSLASWLRQVTINFTKDYIRKLKPLVSIDKEVHEDLALKDIIADESMPASEVIAKEEKIKGLKDCIDRLDEDDKYFLQLHINKGLKLDELKDILRLSRGAIDMRKARIIDRLKNCFENKGFMLDF